ncbi:transcription factor bHLH149-like [Rhododendron vialii]|uniref:transcription factor bHLH149-like n=1 Tax=Rhododendron vialii TaxID=182163 RepID=UPI00265EF008|nr:transcription factor bHLH149-like [Rhododendron vialii]
MMESSSSTSNFEANLNRLQESKMIKKLREVGSEENQAEEVVKIEKTRWKSDAEQQAYSVNLIEALSQRSQGNLSRMAAVSAVRETADRLLATAAKGRTRWSRSILMSRLRLKLNKNKHKKQKKRKAARFIQSKKPEAKKQIPAVQRKARFLSRLVPGCQKLSFLNLLEETTDYIAALEMQVRAMTALAGLLTGA